MDYQIFDPLYQFEWRRWLLLDAIGTTTLLVQQCGRSSERAEFRVRIMRDEQGRDEVLVWTMPVQGTSSLV